MSNDEFDLFVIGGGSGGVRAARMAAQRGVRVALAETQGLAGLGGTCVNLGCIPKKLYSYAAHYAESAVEARGYGWTSEAPVLNWELLKSRRAQEIARLNGIYDSLLRGAGVTVIQGHAELIDANTVRVSSVNASGAAEFQTYRARRFLIATGGRPQVPPIEGREFVITSNEVFDVCPFPSRLLVVGGGYIACEFASIFNGLGSQVTQLYRGEQVLRGFDEEIRHFAAQEIRKHGVDLRLNADVARISQEADGLHVLLNDGRREIADVVLYATGRVPNVQGLGLGAVGVRQSDSGAIVVDEHYRTNVPNVYAVGDVTARVQLTPVALGEAMQLIDHLYGAAAGRPPRTMDYELIPTAVFTHPNIGTVGLTEAQARDQFGEVRIFRSEFRALRHTLSGSSERTLMKLIVDAATDRVVGLHMVGADAGEIVQGFAVAMRAGATKAVFDSTLGIHPTAAEEFVTMREPVR